jgi:hypothetical protein
MNDILTSELEILTWLTNHFVALIAVGVVFFLIVFLVLKAFDNIPRGPITRRRANEKSNESRSKIIRSIPKWTAYRDEKRI